MSKGNNSIELETGAYANGHTHTLQQARLISPPSHSCRSPMACPHMPASSLLRASPPHIISQRGSRAIGRIRAGAHAPNVQKSHPPRRSKVRGEPIHGVPELEQSKPTRRSANSCCSLACIDTTVTTCPTTTNYSLKAKRVIWVPMAWWP